MIELAHAADGTLYDTADGTTVGCHWFLLCDRPATGLTDAGGDLGPVPTCSRCHKFATGEDR